MSTDTRANVRGSNYSTKSRINMHNNLIKLIYEQNERNHTSKGYCQEFCYFGHFDLAVEVCILHPYSEQGTLNRRTRILIKLEWNLFG